MKKILIIEDDHRLAALIQTYLSNHDFQVSLHDRGNHAEEHIHRLKPDLVILDMMLPDKSGLEICRTVRHWYRGFIIIMTASGDDVDEIIGLEIGADDYLSKPIEPRLLLARIRALLRRTQSPSKLTQEPQSPETIPSIRNFDGLEIDSDNRNVTLNNIQIELTTAEFDLLDLLSSHAGQILSRDDIFAQLRGIDFDGLDRSIDARISRLRRKLLDNAENPQRIKTIRGKGYLFLREEGK